MDASSQKVTRSTLIDHWKAEPRFLPIRLPVELHLTEVETSMCRSPLKRPVTALSVAQELARYLLYWKPGNTYTRRHRKEHEVVEENPEREQHEELRSEEYKDSEQDLGDGDFEEEEEEGHDLKCPCCGSALMSVDDDGCVLEDYGPCDCCIADMDLDFQQIYLPELEEAKTALRNCIDCWTDPYWENSAEPLERLVEKIEGDPVTSGCRNLNELGNDNGVWDLFEIVPHISCMSRMWDGGLPGMSGLINLYCVPRDRQEEVKRILTRIAQLAREVITEGQVDRGSE
jgi:hypothetical protein